MLKKVIIIMLVGVLSLTLIPANAIGNDWTFNSIWYQSVVNNAYTTGNNEFFNSPFEGKLTNLFSDKSIFVGHAILDGNGVGSPLPTVSDSKTVVAFPAYSSEVGYFKVDGVNEIGHKYYTYDISFPFAVTIPAQSQMNFQFFQMFGTLGSFIPNATVRLNFYNGEHAFISGNNKIVSTFKNSELGNFTVDGNGTVVDYNTYASGDITVYDCTYYNDTFDDVIVNSVSIYCETKGNGGYIGFFADNSDPVVLPDYVETQLGNISSQLQDLYRYSQMSYNQLFSLTQTLHRIETLIGQENNTVNQYYETIIKPSEEQIIKQEELDKKVEEAQAQLSEIQSILEKEPTVSYNDIQSVTSQADISIDEALNNADTKKFLELIFNNSLISTMLVAVIALATVGYVLFGKKG